MFDRSINKAILVGRLGADPDSRSTPGGVTVVNFNMATDRSWKDRDGNRQKETTWHRIVVWRGLADLVKEYVKKGNMVYVEGHIQNRSWDDPNGQKRYITEVVANDIKLLESSGQRSGDPGFTAPEPPDASDVVDPQDNDVPF